MNDKASKYKSVLVIDDHKMVVNGIKLTIGSFFEYFYMAHDGAGGMSQALQHFPQLIIVDYFLPDTSGDLLVRELKYKIPAAKILVYTFTCASDVIVKMLQSGANGYVIKNGEDEEFTKAVHLLLKGGDYFCKEAKAHIFNMFKRTNDHSAKHVISDIEFSDKELDLMRLLCKQMSTKEIGRYLNLSDRTVEQYRSKIIKRISAKNLGGLIKFALKNGIVNLDEM